MLIFQHIQKKKIIFIQEQHKKLLRDAKENNDSNEVAYLLKDGKVTKLYYAGSQGD